MAVLRESFNSREFDDGKDGRTMKYRALITGARDEEEADVCALGNMPTFMNSGGYILKRESYGLTNEGAGVFRVEAEYAENDEPEQSEDGGSESGQPNGGGGESPMNQGDDEPIGPEWNFQISESTVHITQAIETVGVYTRPGLEGFGLPDYQNGIGVTIEKIEGCDIIAPKETRSCTVRVGGMSFGYLKTIRNLFGCTNAYYMMGCSAGEALYTGFSAQYSGKGIWALTHNFAIGENLVWPAGFDPANEDPDPDELEQARRLMIGDIRVTGGKKAWDYLWVAYVGGIDVVGLTLQVPRYVIVQRVSPEANLKLLGVV